MEKFKRLAGIAFMLVALFGLASCEENEYYLSPEVAIQVPDNGLSVELGGTLEIKADVTNGGENPHYQWYVNDIKVSTSPVLQFRATEPGNNTVKLTVTNGDGTSSDATTILVARAALEASISVVGDRSTTVQYQDSIVLRGLVYSREDYEVEWIREGERVSKEFYYVFKAEKEGTHSLTFKVLDKNGNYVTDDIDITVEVPQLAVTIEEPKNGFRCPQGQTLMLHGEANRVNNVQYEWIVGGQVVCTEPDFEFKGTELNDVEVALRVIDPTQTATATKTITVHHPYLYGTILVGKYDMYFIDYLGNVTEKVFSAANPQLKENEIDFSRAVGYDENNVVAIKENICDWNNDTDSWYTDLELAIIDTKMFTVKKTLKTTFDCGLDIMNLFVSGDRILMRINDWTTETDTPESICEININTGEYKTITTLSGSTQKLILHNDVIYRFTGTHAIAINSNTGDVIYDVDGQAGYVRDMSDDSSWTIINDHIFHTTSSSSYEDYFELATGVRNMILISGDSPRVKVGNLANDGNKVYACNDGFLSEINIETKEQKYIADLMNNSILKSHTLPASVKNLFVSPTGQIIVRFRRGSYDKVLTYDGDWNNPVSVLDLPLRQYVYAFIPKK